MMSNPPQNIVIIGGGIVGCCSAYYISHHPSYDPSKTSVTILEASSIASGASGKAGGLVAKWAYPRELVDVTFREHERLAKEHGGAERWGWRYTNCGQWVGRGEDLGGSEMYAKKSLNKKDGLYGTKRVIDGGRPDDLDWVVDGLTDSYEPMASPGETAQVHPYLFTTSMYALAQEKGVALTIGMATAINKDTDTGSVTSVSYVEDASGDAKEMSADCVIISAGPWSSRILPKLPISGTRAHSITVCPTRPVSAYALFTEIELPDGRSAGPEIYTRPNNEVYACSPGDGEPLPASTREVKVREDICQGLFEQISAISRELRGGEVTVKQACYLPIVNSGPKGCPIVGFEEGAKGLIIATGHTCWGICNAPGTALAVSELVWDGKISCGDLRKLSPRFFI